MRDEIVDYVHHWTERAELPTRRLLGWLGLGTSKFHAWKDRYGQVNEHNGKIPRDFWLEDWEKQAILDFHDRHPLNGYRRLTFMMLDDDIVAVSPTSVYRVLKSAGRLDRKWQLVLEERDRVCPTAAAARALARGHHIHQRRRDVLLPHQRLGRVQPVPRPRGVATTMREQDVELVVQRALEKYPGERPRIISDNGPQFVAKDFKQFIRLVGLTHVRTSPYYPQSNGKKERWYGSLKRECIRPACPASLEEAQSPRVSLRRALQPRPLALCDRLHHAGRQAQRLGRGHLRRTRPQTRRSPAATPTSPTSRTRSCLMACPAAQSSSTWVEDRATQRCDPSADPGAETEGRAALLPPTFTRLRDQHQAHKPSRHEAAKFPTGRSSQVANVNRHKFHFPLNQHTGSASSKPTLRIPA